FFFQAEDGIRDFHVTGVQTCALPIYRASPLLRRGGPSHPRHVSGRPGGERGVCREAWRAVRPRLRPDRDGRRSRDARVGTGRPEIGRASCRERVATTTV